MEEDLDRVTHCHPTFLFCAPRIFPPALKKLREKEEFMVLRCVEGLQPSHTFYLLTIIFFFCHQLSLIFLRFMGEDLAWWSTCKSQKYFFNTNIQQSLRQKLMSLIPWSIYHHRFWQILRPSLHHWQKQKSNLWLLKGHDLKTHRPLVR